MFLLFWCFQKSKSNRRDQKANPIGGHKGCVFAFLVLSEKTNPIGGHKGCVFAFLVLSEKTNPIGGHKGCVFPHLPGEGC